MPYATNGTAAAAPATARRASRDAAVASASAPSQNRWGPSAGPPAASRRPARAATGRWPRRPAASRSRPAAPRSASRGRAAPAEIATRRAAEFSHASDTISSAVARSRCSRKQDQREQIDGTALAAAAATAGSRRDLRREPNHPQPRRRVHAERRQPSSPASCTRNGHVRPLASGTPSAVAADRDTMGVSRSLHSAGIVAINTTSATG